MTAGGLDLTDPAQRTLGRVLRTRAARHPERPFVCSDDVTWTYREVDDASDRYAAGLAGLGVGRGDTVALFMQNAPDQVPLTFGVNRLGAVWVPPTPSIAASGCTRPCATAAPGCWSSTRRWWPG